MFIVTLTYQSSIKHVEKHLEAHKAFLKHYYDNSVFIASGAQKPRIGGVIIASSSSRETLNHIMQEDPFHKHGVSFYTITEFSPMMCCQAFEPLKIMDENIQNQ
ncbi:MAG: YciI family protein [Gammaproteobacteria bacterium]|nr:YciI family protein [Gammaproteobacteria bacterium]